MINAGEANIASSEIDTFGNLHISFHIGSFDTQEVTNKAAENATVVIDDIQVDTCLLYTSPSPRDQRGSRMPSSA